MNKRIALLVLSIAVVVFAVPTALAGKGGGKGNAQAASSCLATGGTVQATGLPTDQVINFMVTDSRGTTGWVLGYTWDGAFTTDVPAANGPTSYAFVSRTWGADGRVFSMSTPSRSVSSRRAFGSNKAGRISLIFICESVIPFQVPAVANAASDMVTPSS